MARDTWPALFVSHGAPTLPLETDAPAHRFMRELGAEWGRPRAIICMSAHWETITPALTGAAQPSTIHDFYGFPDALYALRYAAPGAPELAHKASKLLQTLALPATVEPQRGLDHGAWIPLMLIYPQADVPVLQISVPSQGGPAAALASGRALAPLRSEGVLLMGSGGAVHNLREVDWQQGPPPAWAREFDEWLLSQVTAGEESKLMRYRDLAPHAQRAQPTEEHLLPLFFSLGAGSSGRVGENLHRSFSYGSLSMAAYAFN